MPRYAKPYLSTALLTLALTLSVSAGDGHCPVAPPPPDEDRPGLVQTTSDISEDESSIKMIWDWLAENVTPF